MTDEKTWGVRVGGALRWCRPDLGVLLARLFDQLYAWHRHVRARHELLSLSDHALKDIGISRATAEEAADAPFWRERG